MIIDSGADVSMISRSVADLLGLRYEPKRSVFTAGGSIEAFTSTILITLPGLTSMFVPCIVVDADVPLALGRAGFFDAFDIVFHQKGGVFAVSPAV